MRELVTVMKALSDPGRVKVLKMLEGQGYDVRRIQKVPQRWN